VSGEKRETVVRMNLVPGDTAEGSAAFPHPPPTVGRGAELRYENIAYAAVPGFRPLFLDLRVPRSRDRPPPLIIWIHGGGWMRGSRRRLPPNLFENGLHDLMVDAGYAVAAVDYRLAREAGFPGMLLDVKAAIRWLRGHAAEFGIDAERVVLWGESAGAHLALMAALGTGLDVAERTGEHLDRSETPTAVVDWYGPTDLAALAALGRGGSNPDDGLAAMIERDGRWTYSELSPRNHVRGDAPPVFVAHGTDDDVVPVAQSRELVARLRAVGATVDHLEVPGAGHVWLGAPSVPAIVTAGLDFLEKVI
jgi:acetyl esterase/lipase